MTTRAMKLNFPYPRQTLYLFLSICLFLLLMVVFTSRPIHAATVNCSTASCLQTALTNAQPGDTIVLNAGTTFSGNFVLAANGTAASPITLKSSSATSKAILNGGGTGSGYTVYITGDYWVVQDLKVTNAKKGIMLDNANYTLIDGAEVYNIGEEGVHYRDGSSYNKIQNSYVHDTGQVTADYGEGVYVGSDQGKWGTYVKATNYNTITNVTIGPNVTAEHVDIKEGSTGTIVENCTFNGTGISGANSADSFIDVKGNNDIIRNNTGYRNNNSIIVDAFQVHQRVTGWGQNATFTGNTVYLDTAAPYVVTTDANGTATASGNTRSPSGNMYSGNVTVANGSTSSKLSVPGTSVTASSDDGNVPANTVDGSLSTRWSANGDGQWIRYDLGPSKTVDRIKISWYQGDVRSSSFQIEVSADGTSWTTVYTGASSGSTLNLETVDIADQSARYVRIVGHGNTVNTWNSITETEIWGQ
ncbi:discoidin domain-containing protein [Paenibacillus rigui]|uniref:discoidin domain-containing protein n=1 Tax=Paenibacillus rigui TaxID=554312 RepID=UPI0015C63024|nr:discoidin domain-containing protein [Paenibacillus rigui]